MILITVYMPEEWIKDLDHLVKQGLYKSRAEAIRMAIRDMPLAQGTLKKTCTFCRRKPECTSNA